jgi:hypothetical protein
MSMTEPTALDVAQAIVHHMMQTRALSESQTAWCERLTHEITQALTAARAEGVAHERARCVALVQHGWFCVQSDPPVPVTVERLEGLRAQLVAALLRETPRPEIPPHPIELRVPRGGGLVCGPCADAEGP